MKDFPAITLGHLGIIDHLLLGIAEQQLIDGSVSLDHSSLFARQLQSWSQIMDALRENLIDGAFLPAPIAMDLTGSGLKLKLLMFVHRSGSVLVKNTRIKSEKLSAFKGKTVLVPHTLTIQNMLLHRLLSSARLRYAGDPFSDSDVKAESVHPFLMDEMLACDRDSDIAGFIVAEPYAGMAVLEGHASRVCTTHSLWKEHPCCVFVIRQAIMEEHPGSLQEIVSLFHRIAADINSGNMPDFIEISDSFLFQDGGPEAHFTEKLISESCISFAPELLVPDIRALKMIQEYMADTMGVLKTKTDLNQLVDPSFILNAAAGKPV